jgi:hypothetical protein
MVSLAGGAVTCGRPQRGQKRTRGESGAPPGQDARGARAEDWPSTERSRITPPPGVGAARTDNERVCPRSGRTSRMFRVLAALSGSGQAIVPTVADEGQAGSPPGRFDRAVARDNGLAPAGQAALHRADGQETVRRRKTKRAPVHADRCSVVPLQSPQRGFGRCDVTPQRTATSVKVTRPSGAGDVRNEDRNRDEDPGSTGVSAGRAWPLHPLYHVLGFALARCGTRQPAPPLAPTVQAPIAATIIAPCARRQLHRSGTSPVGGPARCPRRERSAARRLMGRGVSSAALHQCRPQRAAVTEG